MGKLWLGPVKDVSRPSGPEEDVEVEEPVQEEIVEPEPTVSVIEVIREVPVEVIRTVEVPVETIVERIIEVIKEVPVFKEVLVDRMVEVEKVVRVPYVEVRNVTPKWVGLVFLAGIVECSAFLIWLALR